MNYTISQLANRAGVHRETIRYYERCALLPEPERDAKGYRTYSENDLRLLHFIKSAQSLGFSLEEISELLSIQDSSENLCDDVQSKIGDKLLLVREKLTQLEKIERVLENLKSSCTASGSSCPILKSLENEDFF